MYGLARLEFSSFRVAKIQEVALCCASTRCPNSRKYKYEFHDLEVFLYLLFGFGTSSLTKTALHIRSSATDAVRKNEQKVGLTVKQNYTHFDISTAVIRQKAASNACGISLLSMPNSQFLRPANVVSQI